IMSIITLITKLWSPHRKILIFLKKRKFYGIPWKKLKRRNKLISMFVKEKKDDREYRLGKELVQKKKNGYISKEDLRFIVNNYLFISKFKKDKRLQNSYWPIC